MARFVTEDGEIGDGAAEFAAGAAFCRDAMLFFLAERDPEGAAPVRALFLAMLFLAMLFLAMLFFAVLFFAALFFFTTGLFFAETLFLAGLFFADPAAPFLLDTAMQTLLKIYQITRNISPARLRNQFSRSHNVAIALQGPWKGFLVDPSSHGLFFGALHRKNK